MSYVVKLIFVMSVFMYRSVLAQDITLDQYLDRIRVAHPFFNKEKLSADIERERQRGLLGSQDWVLKLSPSYNHTEGNPQSAFSPRKSDNFTFDSSIGREYWENGGRLTLGYDYGYSEQTFSSLADALQQHSNGLTVQYKLPILKNKGGVLSRLDYELQGFNIDVVEINAQENQENFLAQIAERYIDWVLESERLRISESRLHLAEQEYKLIRKKLHAGLSARVDELRAKDAVINAEQALLKARSDWMAVKVELAAQADYSDLLESMPVFDLYQIKKIPLEKDALEELRSYSRLLKSIDLQLERLSKQQHGFEEQKKPDLDVVLGGGLRSEDRRFSDASTFDKPQYFVGLEFRYPLGQTSARSNVSRALIQRRQLQEERASIVRQLKADVRAVLVQLVEINKILSLNQRQITVARQKTGEEWKRYNQGRSELTFVIQSRDNERNSQLSYAANAAFYQKLLLRYRALTDRLLLDN